MCNSHCIKNVFLQCSISAICGSHGSAIFLNTQMNLTGIQPAYKSHHVLNSCFTKTTFSIILYQPQGQSYFPGKVGRGAEADVRRVKVTSVKIWRQMVRAGGRPVVRAGNMTFHPKYRIFNETKGRYIYISIYL